MSPLSFAVLAYGPVATPEVSPRARYLAHHAENDRAAERKNEHGYLGSA